jgi:hypothetical protein
MLHDYLVLLALALLVYAAYRAFHAWRVGKGGTRMPGVPERVVETFRCECCGASFLRTSYSPGIRTEEAKLPTFCDLCKDVARGYIKLEGAAADEHRTCLRYLGRPV